MTWCLSWRLQRDADPPAPLLRVRSDSAAREADHAWYVTATTALAWRAPREASPDLACGLRHGRSVARPRARLAGGAARRAVRHRRHGRRSRKCTRRVRLRRERTRSAVPVGAGRRWTVDCRAAGRAVLAERRRRAS